MLALFVILVGFFSQQALGSPCPAGSVVFPADNMCLMGFSTPMIYLDATRKCATIGGTVVKLENLLQNSYLLSDLIQSDFNGSYSYLGLEQKSNGTWAYADQTPIKYKNWAPGESPDTFSASQTCAIMNPTTGQWQKQACYTPRPFFCTFPACPNGWKYFEKTGSCYFLQDLTFGSDIYWRTYTQATAQAICQKLGANLVSIHSKEEDDFVYDLIASNVSSLTSMTPNGNPCNYQYAWIGLSGTGVPGASTWYDGSPFDYYGRNTTAGSAASFLMTNDESCGYHTWTYSLGSYGRFVCEMRAQK